MEYINSLPAQQRRAMIERLGLAEDEEYDELDEYRFSNTYTPILIQKQESNWSSRCF